MQTLISKFEIFQKWIITFKYFLTFCPFTDPQATGTLKPDK